MELATCKQDSEYFFEDIFFVVGGTMFKVPKHHFERGSTIFRDMFRLPVGPDSVADGTTKEKPLYLANIDEDDFRQLLRVLYPTTFKERLSIPQWTSVLKLSTMWEFDETRAKAIKNLDKMNVDGVTLLALARDYDVKMWWGEALRLLARKPALSEGDVERLGVSLGMKVVLLQGSVSGCDDGVAKAVTSKPAKKKGVSPWSDDIEPQQEIPPPTTPASKPAPKVVDENAVVDGYIRKIFPDVCFLGLPVFSGGGWANRA